MSQLPDRSTVEKTENYLAALGESRALLPSAGPNRPHLRLIAASIGVSYDRLDASQEARKSLNEYGGQHGFAPYLGYSAKAIKEKIAAYADAKRRNGGKIPADSRRPGCISHRGVAAEIGLDYDVDWAVSTSVSQFAAKVLRGIDLGAAFVPQEDDEGKPGDARYAAFDEFLRTRYEETNCPLPESQSDAGRPDVIAILAEHPLPFHKLYNTGRYKARLAEAIAKVGLAVRLKPVAQRVTYASLMEFAAEARRTETAGTKSSGQAVSNLLSACRALMRRLGRSEGDFCDQDLVNNLQSNIDAAIDAAGNGNTARKARAELRCLADYHRRHLRGLGLPGDFAAALREACDRGGVNPPYLERRLGVSRGMISRWLRGESQPSGENRPVVGLIETCLELPKGTLDGLLQSQHGRRPGSSGAVSLSERYGSEIVQHLPDDIDLRPAEERDRIVADIRRSVMRQDRDFSQSLSQRNKDTYVLKLEEWPESARDEWHELVDFKTGVLPPSGMKRAENGRWGAGGVAANKQRLERFYGFAVLPMARGGLGLTKAALGLWLFGFDTLVDRFVRWCMKRRDGVPNTEDEIFLQFAAALIRTKFGPVAQMPDIAERAIPINGRLTATDVAEATAAWATACGNSETSLRELLKHVKSGSKKTRDPLQPVRGFINCDRPMDEYWKFIRRMDEDYPDARAESTRYHLHVRDCVTMRLNWFLKVRSKNLRGLTYRDDQTGQLAKVGGRYVVSIPREQFKSQGRSSKQNRNSGPFVWVLQDKDGMYDLLDQYFSVSRPILMKGLAHDFVLVSLHGRPFTAEGSFSKYYSDITRKYFAHNPHRGTGCLKVMPHGPHAIRHIAVTHILKTTGRVDLAAAAIQDSERTIRACYGEFLPADQNKLVALCLAEEERASSTVVELQTRIAELEAENLKLKSKGAHR